MSAYSRSVAEAERAAAAVAQDRLRVRLAKQHLGAVLHRKLASPGFLIAAFAGGMLAGAALGPRRSAGRGEAEPLETPRASARRTRARLERLAPAALAGLRLLLERYGRGSGGWT